MQTLVPSHIKHKGTLGDKVFVDSATYPYHWRKRPLSAKASLRALNPENKRAAFINKLASELNSIMRVHMGSFKGKDFYHRLLKKFRRESIDNRYLLLRQVEKMHIDKEYPKTEFGTFDYAVKAADKEISVDINTTGHFTASYAGENTCYRYEVLLITWSRKKAPYHSRQACEWIDVPGPLPPKLTFTFSLPSPVSQWLLCVGHRSGKDHVLDPTEENRSMRILEAGSFEGKDLEVVSKPYLPKWQRKEKVELKEVDVWVKVGE
jgi:hypothetical protein